MSGSTKPKKAAGPKPDYELAYLNKTTGASGRIGVAWTNKQTGAISIKLNVLVTVEASPEAVITLFPTATSGSNGGGQPPF